MPTTLADEMLLSTVKIEATKAGLPISTGTGFLWGTEVGQGYVISLLTNKHVMRDADGFVLDTHIADASERNQPSGQYARLTVARGPHDEISHPDADVDLLALNVHEIMTQTLPDGRNLAYRHLSATHVPIAHGWSAFDSIEEVIMVGYPRGISDTQNNMPIARRGITATSIRRDFNGRREFMIDLTCFPGSSGSPVFYYESDEYLSFKNLNKMQKPKFALLGLLHAGPTVTNEGEIVLSRQPKLIVSTMMHLGQVIRADRVLELDEIIKSKIS